MSFPNIPNVTPSISINRSDVINLLLASVAFEELGLAHIINAEAEKIQAVVGTLPVPGVTAGNIGDLITINETVNRTLKTALKTQMLLQFKLEDILDIQPCEIALVARQVIGATQGQSTQVFTGVAQGTNQVTAEIFLNGTLYSSTSATVNNNGQFSATLTVPEGLPPGNVITIRVTSADQQCSIEQLVSSIPQTGML